MNIHNGCCLDVLKTIPNDSVQSVYIDPPFNSGRHFFQNVYSNNF